MKHAVVLGAGGFIGNHLVRRLKQDGIYVIAADLFLPHFSESLADEFFVGDLRDFEFVKKVIPEQVDEVYQLAAEMGGAGYIFSGIHDADIMSNSVQINLNVAKVCVLHQVKSLFYASSACIYPEFNQQDPQNPKCNEDSAYPASPDSEYGWEKLFSERLFLAYKKNHGLNVKIGRYHNVYGTESAWNDGREKAPAALCRKVAEAETGSSVEIWGDGLQTRSFLFIEDCIDATFLVMRSEYTGPFNIGSEEMISINDFLFMIAKLASKELKIKNIEGFTGVRGRNSDNELIESHFGWKPKTNLETGIHILYRWIEKQAYSCQKY